MKRDVNLACDGHCKDIARVADCFDDFGVFGIFLKLFA